MATINFNDDIFIQEAFQAFTASLTPLNAFSRNFSGATASKGDAIFVPRVEQMTATTFSYSTNSSFPYEAGGGVVNTITVNLNEHKIVTADLTDVQAASSSAANMVNFARQQGKALGKLVLSTLWSIVTPGTFGAAATSASIASFAVSNVRQLQRALNDRDVPTDAASLIVNNAVYDSLLGDANITQAYAYGGAEAIRNGVIPGLYGFDVYRSNILPANGVSLVGMAVHPDSIAVAVRALQAQAPEAYLETRVVTDDESGISMGYRRHFNPGRGVHYASFECLFGFSSALTLGLAIASRRD